MNGIDLEKAVKTDNNTYLEIARYALDTLNNEWIGKDLDLSDEEIKRLKDNLEEFMNEKSN